jgi:uncharacterized membrane protein
MRRVPRSGPHRPPYLSEWRREALRATLWLVPTIQIVVATALFGMTYVLDRAAYRGDLDLPAWVNNGSADAARQILTAIAAAIITVIGLVFSITIVALTLASTQFGPRILRNFLRDRGTQVTLGAFVATAVYVVLTLGSIAHGARGDFVPHLSITLALGLVLVDLAVLIYFIHHVATSIHLPQVIASIAHDLTTAIDAEVGRLPSTDHLEAGMSETEIAHRLDENGTVVRATRSGYVQFIGYPTLVDIAMRADGVIRLLNRPGHFVVEGLPLAQVWPPNARDDVARNLTRAHATGAHRTLTQDLAFAIDQLVEIALRALSPAVNDTFTALTCIDWLGDGLCKLTVRWNPTRTYRDRQGHIRVISAETSYQRLVERAFDKIRQASTAMPAVMIRQLDALARIMGHTTTEDQRSVLREQADMILRSAEDSVREPRDLADVRRRHDPLAVDSSSADRDGQLDPRPHSSS